MASISLPRVLTQRRGPVEVERENFEKAQSQSITKAINNQENPVKEKHVRSAIIGTYHEKGSTTFWGVVGTLPVKGNPIVCWKFSHTLHKLLREGHPNVIPESIQYKGKLIDLGKYWSLLRDSYGKLNSNYCKLLATKLDFHAKNPKFPGNLALTDEQLESIGEMDINNFFQISVEMFDYMDEILSLQGSIFGCLETGRSNSMTSSGQCRLAPLIPCIQDSSHLYDYLVKLLFRLHASLPPDVLIGHRDRFYKQFKVLRDFYKKSSVLQYFKHLIQIPLLPEEPPNFLIGTELSFHVSPVVILPPHEDIPDNDSVQDAHVVDSSPLLDFEPTNGSSHEDLLFEKEQLIERLRREIEELRREIHRIKAEDHQIIEELRHNLAAMENRLTSLMHDLQSKHVENEKLQTKAKDCEENAEAAAKLVEIEKRAKANDEKFQKMKDVYNKLREEHITLIRNKADVEKQLSTIKQTTDGVEKDKSGLENKISKLDSENSLLGEEVKKLKGIITSLETNIQTSQQQSLAEQQKMAKDSKEAKFSLLVSCIEEAENIVQAALKEIDNPATGPLSCTPDYLLALSDPLRQTLARLQQCNNNFTEKEEELEGLLKSVTAFSHFLGQFIIHGRGTANASPDIDQGDHLLDACRTSGQDTLVLLASMKTKGSDSSVSLAKVRADIMAVTEITEAMIKKLAGTVEEKIGDLVEQELTEMDRAIEEAAARIEEILRKSRQAESGVKLEVSEKILDACTSLMQSIKILVQRSKVLQLEIVAQGKGSASAKEFYKRNHQWTEGLLSAAKAVGIGAKFLVDAADKVVSGKAKFEVLMAASQEIAASTAQLVVASKVKADPGSQNLRNLSQASKGVTGNTGNVVATVKNCAQMLEDSDVMDFTKLTLHQAKRLEMESQVRVLELENGLEKERVKLSALRKTHYSLAGPGEGWDEEKSNQK